MKMKKAITVFPVSRVSRNMAELGVIPYDDNAVEEDIIWDKSGRYIRNRSRDEAVSIRLNFLHAQLDAIYATRGISYIPTLDEIGSFIGVSRERIRQIQSRAIKRLYAKRREFTEEIEGMGFNGPLASLLQK